MAQSVPPGDINTQPGRTIVFNAPYDDKHTYHIKITNTSARRIGWAIKTTNLERLGVDPTCGLLWPTEQVLMAVTCCPFSYAQEDKLGDRIVVEWTNSPPRRRQAVPSRVVPGRRHGPPREPRIEYNP